MVSLNVSSHLAWACVYALLVCCVSAGWREKDHNNGTVGCNLPKITRDNFNTTSLAAWFQAEYDIFRTIADTDEHFLRDFFLKRWTTVDPVLATSSCNVAQQCSVSTIVGLTWIAD
jgi:hypothetical protein